MRVLSRAIVALLMGAALGACQQPEPVPVPVLEEEPARWLRHVEVLSADSLEGREAGTPGSAKARRYLTDEYGRIGLEPLGEGYLQPFAYKALWRNEIKDGINVLGRLPATGPDTAGTIVLTAHYDHLGRRSGRIYNGADDNASGVGAMLAVAERLAGQARRHRFVFAALDAEEVGLRGARALVLDGPVDMARVVLNVNLDMISRSDEQILFAAGTNFTPSLRPFVQGSAAEGVDLRFGHDEPDGNELRDWTYASDHGEFHRAGLPYLYFGVDEHPDYHRPTDDFERIDPVFYTAVVETIIAAVKRIDAGWPGPAEGAL